MEMGGDRTMKKPFINHVCLAHRRRSAPGSCRRGTVFATYKELKAVLGSPHEEDWSEEAIHGDGKVHFCWYIITPRGIVEIGDYWWNPKEKQSIRTAHNGAYWWIKGFFKLHGISCRQGS